MTHGLFGLLALCTLFALPGCGSDEPELPKADELLVEARDAIAAGRNDEGLNLLNQSIDAQPDAWAYFERAKLLAKLDRVDEARRDVAAGLKLDPNNEYLQWLEKELKQPDSIRFSHGESPPPVDK